MYSKSTLFALMASGLAAAIPVPHELPSVIATSLSTEHAYETPTAKIPGYGPTGGEITATVTVPGYEQKTPNVAATPTTSYGNGLALPSDHSIAHPTYPQSLTLRPDVPASTHVETSDPDSISLTHIDEPLHTDVDADPDASISSTNVYTSTEIRQEIVVSTPAPPVVTPTSYPAREGATSVPAVEKPEIPTVTGSSGLLHTSASYPEHPEVKESGTSVPSGNIPEVGVPTAYVPSVEHPEISAHSTTIQRLDIKPTETPKVPSTGAPSVEYPAVVKPSTSAPSVEYPAVKPTDINLPSGSEAPKFSITYIPSPTFPAEVQKPTTNPPSVEYPEIKTTRVKPDVSAPTVTNVKKPEAGSEHRNGPSVNHPSIPDITKVGGGANGSGDAPSVTHPSILAATKTKDLEYKVPNVSQPTPSSTTTSGPDFHNVNYPSGTPGLGSIKGKTEGEPPSPSASGVPTPKIDDVKGKGKGSGEVEDDGEWEIEYSHGPWGAEAEGDHKGVKTEVENGGGD